VAVQLADEVEKVVFDRVLIVPGGVDEQLAVERRIEEYAERAGVGLAVLRLHLFTRIRVVIERAAGDRGEE